MNLLVDAGNSRLKWAFADADGGGLRDHEACLLREDPDGAVRALLASVRAPAERMLVANVAGPWVGKALERNASRLARRPADFVHTTARFAGVSCGYADPARLGVDRWLAVLAARQADRGPAVVVDVGTAATVDALTGDGRHLGGWILPGAAMMAASLYRGTSDIPPTAEVGPPGRGADAFGRDTAQGVWFGAIEALAGAIERAIHALRLLEQTDVRLVLTGGGAVLLTDCVDHPAEHRPHLVLEGLACVAAGADA